MQRERSSLDRLDDRNRYDDHDRYDRDDDAREARGRAKQFRNDQGDKVASDVLRSVVDKIERLEEDKAAINLDIKEIYARAKGDGFDVTGLRKLIALRKKPADDRMKAQRTLEMYIAAMGMPDID